MMGVLVETEQPSTWIPPPKKKWIRHYLLSEVPKDYKTYAALQHNSSSSAPAAAAAAVVSNNVHKPCLPPPPPPPLLPPPAPSKVHTTYVNGVNLHLHSPPPKRAASPPPPPPPPPPSHYGTTPPSHDGSYLAARLTAPPPEPVKSHHNHVTQLGSPPPSHHHVQQTNSPGSDTHDLKRRLGAGTREVHNKLEKNRRAHLKECFELLRRQLPSSHDDKKPSNLSVLHSALRYIQSLKRKERDYEHEMERLAREKIACQQRLAALKKELSAQWDHIDFATLLPEAPPVPTTQACTPVCAAVSVASTAPASSRGTGRSFDSDEDFEFEEMDDELEMRRGGGGQRSDVSPQHSASTSTASERGHPSDVEDLTMSSRPGSSRDQYSSPPPPAPSLAARPPEHPHRGPPTLSLAAELARNNAVIKGEPVSVVKTEGKAERPEVLQSSKLQVAPQIHLSPQLVSAPGIMATTGTTIVGPTIQLLATQPLRMITPDHRQQADAASRLPGGAEINVVSTSTMACSGTATLVRSPSKPINLSVSNPGASVPVTKLVSHSIINGGVISHAPAAMHRPPAGGSSAGGATVLTTMHGTPTVVGTHHLSSATGIAHVVTAGGTTHLSALTPLVAGPVTMVTPGNHHPGVHILATHTGKPPFQVVSGPLLKTHQVLPAQYLSTSAQLVKPVMMVSSPGMGNVPRPQEPSGGSGGGP